MKQLICEMCGSPDLIKQEGLFVCQSCGCKYSVEEAKRMMIEGTVDVQGVVKVDTSDELKNLYQIARRAKDDNNGENALKYYDLIMVKDPTSWEASFYVVYFRAVECKIAEIQSAGISVANSINTVLNLVKEYVEDKDEQIKAVQEIASRCTLISGMLDRGARQHYANIGESIRPNYVQKMVDNRYAATLVMYTLGDKIDTVFAGYEELQNSAVSAWKDGITKHNSLMHFFDDKEFNKNVIMRYVNKIKKYDSTYQEPEIITKQGCYVATAIYGSYDCPQVWTLRRYRDYTLAETSHGRLFIHTYYAISPVLVKWFGHTEWFKKMWKGKLDLMVEKLQANGVESTPYEDRNW